MQRRRLVLGVLSLAALAIGGGSLALLRPGLQGGRLTSSGREVFAAVARAVLDGTMPQEATALEASLARIDALIAALPPHAQVELSRLLALLASAPGRRTFAGLTNRWAEATVPQVQEALQAMRVSRVSLRQQAYQALHDIVGAAYFSDETTWARLGYPGPVAI
jgi:hypothetical protein